MRTEDLEPSPVEIAAFTAGVEPARDQRQPCLGGRAGVPEPADEGHKEGRHPRRLIIRTPGEEAARGGYRRIDVECRGLCERQIAEHLVRNGVSFEVARDAHKGSLVLANVIRSRAFGCAQREAPAACRAGNAARRMVLARNLAVVGVEIGKTRGRAPVQHRSPVRV